MKLSTPRWWYGRSHPPAWRFALYPFSWLWAAATARRVANGPVTDPGAPVVCVGNLTVGGTGKTPVAREIALRLKAQGKNPLSFRAAMAEAPWNQLEWTRPDTTPRTSAMSR